MSSEWYATTLGEICKFTAGSAFKPEHQGGTSGQYPFIKVSDMNLSGNEIFICHANNFVSSELKDGMNAKEHPAGATVFAKIGVALQSNRRRLLVKPTIIDNNMMSATPKTGKVSSRFLYFVLSTLDFNTISAGSALPYLNVSDLQKMSVRIPRDAKVQQAIENVLGAIDDRISLLRETNTTLEAIAQALFKSWFVDFDPVQAKMQGRAPEGMDEGTAALFPDSFEESELGPVPKGWKPIRLDSFIELAYGKALKSDMRRPGPVPVYGSGGITGWHDTALVKEASVVVGRKGTVGSIFWESRPFFPIDTVFYVKAYKPLTYCHQLLMTLGLNDMNTDAAVPGLNRENVYRLKVPDVPSVATAAFDDIVSALRRSINRNNDQAQTLSDARDALLPRLISGQHQLKGSYA
jgi:type I restriction enzyme S subunit